MPLDVRVLLLVFPPDSLKSVGIKNPLVVMETTAVGSAAVVGYLMARKSECGVLVEYILATMACSDSICSGTVGFY